MRVLLILLAFPLLAVSCGPVTWGGSGGVTALVLDGSGSRTPELRAMYLDLVAQLGREAEPGDWIVGDLVTGHSIETSLFGINVEFPTLDVLSTSELDHAEALEAARQGVVAQAESLLAVAPSPCTDLLNAFTTAERAFGARRDNDGARAPAGRRE